MPEPNVCWGKCPGEGFVRVEDLQEGIFSHEGNVQEEYPEILFGVAVRILTCDYMFLHLAVTIRATLVNTHAHRKGERDGETDRQTDTRISTHNIRE